MARIAYDQRVEAGLGPLEQAGLSGEQPQRCCRAHRPLVLAALPDGDVTLLDLDAGSA